MGLGVGVNIFAKESKYEKKMSEGKEGRRGVLGRVVIFLTN